MKREEEIAAEEKNARKEKRKQQIQKLEGLVKPSKRQQRSENTTRLEDFDRDMQEQIIAVLRKRKETKISDCGLYVFVHCQLRVSGRLLSGVRQEHKGV